MRIATLNTRPHPVPKAPRLPSSDSVHYTPLHAHTLRMPPTPPQVAFKRLRDNVPIRVRGVLRELESKDEVAGAILRAVVMGAAGAAGELGAGVGVWDLGLMGAAQEQEAGWGGGRGAGMQQQAWRLGSGVWGQQQGQQGQVAAWQRGGGWRHEEPEVMVEGGWQ